MRRESQEGGALRPDAGRILEGLLAFGDVTAGEVMTPRINVAGIPLGAGKQQLSGLLVDSPHARYPVYEGDLDHIAGSVHIKDLLPVLLNGVGLTRGDIQPVAFVPHTSPLDVVLSSMHKERTQLAAAVSAARASRWIRLGRALDVGPELKQR